MRRYRAIGNAGLRVRLSWEFVRTFSTKLVTVRDGSRVETIRRACEAGFNILPIWVPASSGARFS
jgi:hypothetical protein